MELALVVLPLLLLLLGIVEFGRVFYMRLRLQQAAQQTARQIALHYDDPGITIPALDGLIDDTLDTTLAGVVESVGDLSTYDIDKCLSTEEGPQDARVTLGTDVEIALPVDPIPVGGTATMPCEG